MVTVERPAELGRVRMDSGETVVVRRNGLHGQEFLDVRVFTPDTSSGPGLPTDKGVCAAVGTWREVLPLIVGALGQ